MTGNLTTPKYTKTYASFTIAVSVFVEKSAQLRPKTCKNGRSLVGTVCRRYMLNAEVINNLKC